MDKQLLNKEEQPLKNQTALRKKKILTFIFIVVFLAVYFVSCSKIEVVVKEAIVDRYVKEDGLYVDYKRFEATGYENWDKTLVNSYLIADMDEMLSELYWDFSDYDESLVGYMSWGDIANLSVKESATLSGEGVGNFNGLLVDIDWSGAGDDTMTYAEALAQNKLHILVRCSLESEAAETLFHISEYSTRLEAVHNTIGNPTKKHEIQNQAGALEYNLSNEGDTCLVTVRENPFTEEFSIWFSI